MGWGGEGRRSRGCCTDRQGENGDFRLKIRNVEQLFNSRRLARPQHQRTACPTAHEPLAPAPLGLLARVQGSDGRAHRQPSRRCHGGGDGDRPQQRPSQAGSHSDRHLRAASGQSKPAGTCSTNRPPGQLNPRESGRRVRAAAARATRALARGLAALMASRRARGRGRRAATCPIWARAAARRAAMARCDPRCQAPNPASEGVCGWRARRNLTREHHGLGDSSRSGARATGAPREPRTLELSGAELEG